MNDSQGSKNSEEIVGVLRELIDPELGVNVVDLGLVYSAKLDDGRVEVVMTMTTPTCPLSAFLADMARALLHQKFPQAREVNVELVWDPPWDPEMMSPQAREKLGW